jgi:glycerophosphoryl diester phosphodiesterase
VLLLAHRGYHRDHPENTMAAFEAAAKFGADGIETDIRETRDRALVLFHNAKAPNDKPISELTKIELEQAAGYAVPTMDEALLGFPDIFWNLEIKAPADAARLAPAFKPYQFFYRLLVTSFDHDLIANLVPQINADCGLLFDQRHDDLKRYLKRRVSQRLKTIVVDYAILDAELLDVSRELGFRTFVYGVVSQEDHARCTSLDLAGVITDYPDRMALAIRNSSL